MEWLGQNWLWVVVAIAVVAIALRRGRGRSQHMQSVGETGSTERHGHGANSRANAHEATDPVTGAALRTDHALSSVYAGRIFYFESADTRQRFEANPEGFSRGATGVPVASEAAPRHRHHGC